MSQGFTCRNDQAKMARNHSENTDDTDNTEDIRGTLDEKQEAALQLAKSGKMNNVRANNIGNRSAIAAIPLYIVYHAFLVGFASCAMACLHLLWMHLSCDIDAIRMTLEWSPLLGLFPMSTMIIWTSCCYSLALQLLIRVCARFPETLRYWVFCRFLTTEDRACIPVQSITVLFNASRKEMYFNETFRDFFKRCEVDTVDRYVSDSSGRQLRWCQTPIDCNLQPYSSLELRAQEDLDLCKLKGGARSVAPSKHNATKLMSATTKRGRGDKGTASSSSKRFKNAASPHADCFDEPIFDTPYIGLESDESTVTACTREQLIDIETLTRHMYSLPVNDEQRKACKALLEACEVSETFSTTGERELIGRVKVEYRHQIVKSRIYPARHNWWHDIFSQRKDARGAAGYRIYVDLDIENCFPVLLEYLCAKHNINAPKLVEYNAKRDECIGEIIEHYQPKSPDQRKAVKALFSAGYNGAGNDFISKWREEHSVHTNVVEHPFIVEFFRQNSAIAQKLVVEYYKDVLDDVKLAMPHKDRPIQTALHCVLARMETECRDIMERVANDQEISPKLKVVMDSSQHDGAYFRVDTPDLNRDWYCRHVENMRAFDWETLCKHMSDGIEEQHGYPVTVVMKNSIKDLGPLSMASVFRLEDFIPSLPLNYLMQRMNRHFCMLTGQGTDAVGKITYVRGSDNIKNVVSQSVSSFKQTFAGMMVPIVATGESTSVGERSGGKHPEKKEKHNNEAFADWLEDEGTEIFLEKWPRRKPVAMHIVAEAVRQERGFFISSRKAFIKISCVDKAILDIGTEYFDTHQSEKCTTDATTIEDLNRLGDAADLEGLTAEASQDDRYEDSEGDGAEDESRDSVPTKYFDLAAYWCRSLRRHCRQQVVFEPKPYGNPELHTGEDSENLNLYSGLPYDGCLSLGSTCETHTGDDVCTTDDPEASIGTNQAAYIALQNPVAKFKGPVPKGAAVILRHIENDLCGGDLNSALYLIRIIAYGLRYRKKAGVLVILVGEKGTGKTIIFGKTRDCIGLIPRLYGIHWKEAGSVGELQENFSDDKELDCMVVTLEEVSDFGGSANARRAKAVELLRLITGGEKKLHMKHATKTCVNDFRNFFALVNPENKDAFTIQQGDRRFVMIEGSDAYSQRAQDENRVTAEKRREKFDELVQAINDETSVQWLARYLVHDVCLDNWNPEDIPKTKIRCEQQELTVCAVQRFLMAWQAQSEEDHDYVLFYMKEVPKTDIHGRNQMAFEEERRPLEASPSIEEKRVFKPVDVFYAFKGWGKKTGADTLGVPNLNVFGHKLSMYLYDETRSPGGILHKEKRNTGIVYWILKASSSN